MKHMSMKLFAILLLAAFAAFGQSEVSKDPVTVMTDIYYWKTAYDGDSTMVTVVANCSDGEATHYLISVSWAAGADTGSQTKLVKRLVGGSGYVYVMVAAKPDRVTLPAITVTPVKVQPMSTARYTMSGKEYVEP